ncbi:SdrD B-like domain-containing protein [Kineosporia sp. R_H_3]|uniref:SdrD B-like domain-containing protein n=1 Tax=Kineosporia sp. R_H_3 TaxID=1961848 RepID=UPI000B4AB122|nr:SdrD B-like domain-containing protein [Kineosporia sp. R_H_3]
MSRRGLRFRQSPLARRRALSWLVVPALAVAATVVPILAGVVSPAQAATPSRMWLEVVSSATGSPAVGEYRWLVTREGVQDVGDPSSDRSTPEGAANLGKCLPASNAAGDTKAGYTPALSYQANAPVFGQPDPVAPVTSTLGTANCPWPSVRPTAGDTHTVASGDQDDVAADGTVTFTDGSGAAAADQDLAPGRYLVSVVANGFKIGGAHFSVPMTSSAPATVTLPTTPTPLGNIRVQVFEDAAFVDGTYAAGAEGPDPGNNDVFTKMPGFQAFISDVMGPVTTDFFGNPLCTHYVHTPKGTVTADTPDGDGPIAKDPDGRPVVDGTKPAKCVTDARNQILIPNLGPNRYGVTVNPPAGQVWSQTTNLEGGHDHDVWVMENDTGFDTELVVGGEPVPFVPFGFVKPKSIGGGTNTVTGQVMAGLSYIGGPGGGQTIPAEPGVGTGAYKGPIDRPWVALSDLNNGDKQAWTGRGDADGTFTVSGVPDGTYALTTWDDAQNYIIQNVTISVQGGETLDVGKQFLPGWFTEIKGTVFVDDNGNGRRDAGEQGLKNTIVTLRERDNTLMDQFANTATTDQNGHYALTQSYPLTKWLVLEHFNTLYEGTGVTVQASNDPTPTTYHGSAVDISVANIIGLGGTVDWGVKPYDAGTNGGIAGTVSYDTTRNELDPRYDAAEPYQPGIPDVTVNLYPTLRCETGAVGVQRLFDPKTGAELPWVDEGSGDPVAACTPGALIDDPDGTGEPHKDLSHLLGTTVTEHWAAPTGCTARDYQGKPLTDQLALPAFGDPKNLCVEAPMGGFQARPSEVTTDADGNNVDFAQTVNGNYGFSESELNLFAPGDPKNPAAGHDLPLYANLADAGFDPQPLPADDYVVQVVSPQDDKGKPVYQVTKEEDVNVFDGDGRDAQENFAHGQVTTVDQTPQLAPGDAPTSSTPPEPPSQQAGIVPACVGAPHTVRVTNPNFADAGGSPFEGQDRPLCDERLVTLRSQQAVAPTFFMFTPVPLPTHFWGIVINDLGLTYDPRSTNYGEAQGIGNVPVGLYDFRGDLVDTVTTDFNGFYEAIEPSTSSYNCPLPAGPCPGMYRFVGNDPGQPDRANANYDPRFRTIATNFQAWPGLYTVTDTAPTMVANQILTPGSTTPTQPNCDVVTTDIPATATAPGVRATPQLFASSKVVLETGSNASARAVALSGAGFGTTKGRVTLTTPSGGVRTLQGGDIATWSPTRITFTAPNLPQNTYQVAVTTAGTTALAARSTVTGLTLHVVDSLAHVFMVNPPANLDPAVPAARRSTTVQGALDKARDYVSGGSNRSTPVVVVYPNPSAGAFNAHRGYVENVIVQSRVRLQGVGPGGLDPVTKQWVAGSELSGLGFDADPVTAATWYDKLASQPHGGIADVADAAVVTIVPPAPGGTVGRRAFLDTTAGRSIIDGFSITGGHQMGGGGNVNAITGAVHTAVGSAGATVTQGGGIYAHAYAHDLQVTNNVIAGNDGTYGGAVRIGTPFVDNTNSGNSNQNRDIRIANNYIRDNGGINLAGAVGIFSQADRYVVDRNVLCGNFSAEYGGAVTVYGRSPNGSVTNNDVYYNLSYDEGGALMLAGELPADPDQVSRGIGQTASTTRVAGNEFYYNNSNDDGGAVRLLQAGTSRFDIYNNMIADNVSAHEGGGVALDDAPNVRFYNNTVVNNVTTATAITSDGRPAPAGLSTGDTSVQLRAAAGLPQFSPPVMFNNVFGNNRAGTWDAAGGTVTGIGIGGTSDVRVWDMGAPGSSGVLTINRSVYQPADATGSTDPVLGTGNTATAATFFRPVDLSVSVLPWRTMPAFRQAMIVTQNLPLSRYSLDYRLRPGANSAAGLGRSTVGGVAAPATDFEGTARNGSSIDAGADER